jgi:hypothetical protein
MKIHSLLCVFLFSSFVSSFAAAATVTWSPTATAINSNDDIINPGNVIDSVNFGNDSAVIPVVAGGFTINFDNTGISGGRGFYSDGFFEDDNPAPGTVSGDNNSEFHRVLDSFHDNGTTTYTFSNLNAGETYQLQVFASDDRAQPTAEYAIEDEANQLVSQTYNIDNSVFRSAFFTAEITLGASETSFELQRIGGAGRTVNAAILTQAATAPVPEPASVATWCMLLGSIFLMRRIRSR